MGALETVLLMGFSAYLAYCWGHMRGMGFDQKVLDRHGDASQYAMPRGESSPTHCVESVVVTDVTKFDNEFDLVTCDVAAAEWMFGRSLYLNRRFSALPGPANEWRTYPEAVPVHGAHVRAFTDAKETYFAAQRVWSSTDAPP